MTRQKKTNVLCLNRSGGVIPVALVKNLSDKLLSHFAGNRIVRRSVPPKNSGREMLVVVFVTSTESRRLNSIYRGKDYATDVLSFSPETKGEGLGELVMCLPVLKRQAREQGHSVKKEVETLLVHGFLHLLGYDHEKSRKEELKMFRLQDRLIAEFSKG